MILCPNPYRDSELTVAKRSGELLEELGFETVVCLPFSREGYDDQLGVPIRQLQQEIKRADMLIAFGGDGTILHLTRTVALHNVPVLGINLGSLGFMSELEPNELERLRDLKSWDFAVESRMMLDVTVLREGKPVYNNIALNDAVISKGSVAGWCGWMYPRRRPADQDHRRWGHCVHAHRIHRVLYGGRQPIVEPTAHNLLLTPICPHSTRAGSYAALTGAHAAGGSGGRQSEVRISVCGRREGVFAEKRRCSADRQSKFVTKLVRLSKKSFCEILDSKMGMEALKHEK